MRVKRYWDYCLRVPYLSDLNWMILWLNLLVGQLDLRNNDLGWNLNNFWLLVIVNLVNYDINWGLIKNSIL